MINNNCTAEEAFDELCRHFINDEIVDPKYKDNPNYYRARVEMIKHVTEDAFRVPVRIARISIIACIILSAVCLMTGLFLMFT